MLCLISGYIQTASLFPGEVTPPPVNIIIIIIIIIIFKRQ